MHRRTARGSEDAETRVSPVCGSKPAKGHLKTPRAPSGNGRRKRYRHTRDKRPASQPATFTGRKTNSFATLKGARPGHVNTALAGSGTPAAERRRRMTRGGRDARFDAATRVARNKDGASRSKRAASIRAESIGPTPPARKTARTDRTPPCVGATRCHEASRVKEVACDSRSTVEAGSPVRVAAHRAQARRGKRALKGTRTSREASDRSWHFREATPVACSPRNRAFDRTGGAGGARSARKGGREPERRSARRRQTDAPHTDPPQASPMR